MQQFKKFKWLILVIALSVVSIVSIAATSKDNNVGTIQNIIATPINKIQEFIYQGTAGIRKFASSIKEYKEVIADNERLLEENQELKAKLDVYKERERRYEEFEKMFEFKSSVMDFEYVATEITGISGNNYLNGYIINKGNNDGIEVRMVAITSDGLVGQVTSVGKDWAKVQTLANENIAVAGYVERTEQTNGLVTGYKDENNRILARIELPSLEADIKPGDIITTSGLGGIYPKGIKIGEVIEVYEDKSKVTKYGVIKPYVNIDKLSEVFIVKSTKAYEDLE